MTKIINSMILNDFERPGIPNLLIDFKKRDQTGYVSDIEIPEDGPNYMIETQVTEDEIIVAFDIINFPVFLAQIDEDIYLPNLGDFSYKDFPPMPLKELLKQIDFAADDYSK